MKMRRIAAVCLAAVCLTVAAGALAGCGPNDEELVRQTVTENLELVKARDAGLLEKLTSEADAESLAAYGIDPAAFLEAYLEGFDYRVDEVAVDGEAAQATVVLTCKSYDSFDSALSEAVASLSAGEGVANMSESEIDQLVGQCAADALAALEPVEKAPVQLEFALKDGAWTPNPGVVRALSGALFAAA